MKRGTLAFLGRKDQSLYDTSIKMREMDNVELVLNSPTSPESGTANVRARPTVKHYITSETFQGFAVPTPRVPVLPTISSPKINGAVNGDKFTYGLEDEELLVPPPPSMAPPPPPETFILPPPDFLGYLSSLEMAALQPPPTHAPKPPLKEEKTRSIMKTSPVAPPKPPSIGSSGSASSTPISKPSPAKVPKHPKFAPPPPPGKEQQKTTKTPPPKPIRLSSMANLNSPPQIAGPSRPVQTPTQSTFNPQNTAKINHVSNTSILKGYVKQDPKPKQMLVLEDTGSATTVPMLVPVNGNVPRQTPTKPIRKDPLHHKENLQSTRLTQTPLHEQPKSIPNDVRYHKENIQSTRLTQTPLNEQPKSLPYDVLYHKENIQSTRLTQTPLHEQPKSIPNDVRYHKENIQSTHLTQTPLHEQPKSLPYDVLYHKQNIQSTPPSRSPMPEVTTKANTVTMSAQNETIKPLRVPYQIPRKLQTGNKNLMTSEDIQGKLDPKPANKLSPSLGHELHNPKNGESNAAQEAPAASPFSLLMAAKERDRCKGIQPHEIGNMMCNQRRGSPQNNSIPQTFPPISRWVSTPSLLHQDKVQVSPTSVNPVQYWETKSVTVARVSNGPTYSSTEPTSPTGISNRLVKRNDSYVKSGWNLGMILLPPPPEFDDFYSITESPPSTRPPDPRLKMAPRANINSLPPAHIPPSTLPKPSKHPFLNASVQPKPHLQTHSTVNPAQQPKTLSPSQATLVSILQKKMLEMDHKITTTNEADYDAEDWGVPLYENVQVLALPKTMPEAKNVSFATNQTPTHHKQEAKVLRNYPEINSNELQSSQQCGMTYRIRPGTKQPITLIRKGPS